MLFAGSVLPVTLKFGIFGDLSGDGAVDQNDAMIWMRRQYPLADAVYRHGLIVKLDSDTTSYVQGEGKKRISFHDTLSIVKELRCVSKRSLVSFLLNFAQLCCKKRPVCQDRLGTGIRRKVEKGCFARTHSEWSDNQTIVVHLVGWQGSGHDTLYPSLDKVNPNVGTVGDLIRLAEASRQYNTIISYHINTDEAYVNYTATSCSAFNDCNYSVHPVPGTQVGKRALFVPLYGKTRMFAKAGSGHTEVK